MMTCSAKTVSEGGATNMASVQLRSVPARPLRILGVVRVSKERDGMISPELQITSITDYCASRGYQLIDIIEGIDESGSQRRSSWWRKLDEAVASVETGAYDGIVVWKFSRTARHRLRWAVAVDRVEVAGGILESSTEQFDTSTSAGRFARGMVAEMNAFEAERIGEVWKEAHDRRIKAGRPHDGKARWGYVYDLEDKIHKPHPEQGPVLADLYRRYVAGETIYHLVRWLNSHGWRGGRGNPWSDSTLRKTLDSGFGAGFFRAGGDPKRKIAPTLHQGVHEPVIDLDLWQAYLDARVARRKVPPRNEGSGYLLSGLVRCARCGSSMTAYREDPSRRYDNRRKKSYPTKGLRLAWRCRRCPELGNGAAYIKSEFTENYVLDHLRELAGSVDEDAADKVVVDARRTLLQVEVDRLAREGAKLQEALVRLAVSNAENPLPPEVYTASKVDLEKRAAEVAAALEAAGAQSRRVTEEPARKAAELLELWEELPIPAKREILRGLIDCVLVRSSRTDPWMRVVEWHEARS